MTCNIEQIPAYLHWNGRTIYSESSFSLADKIYRLTKKGNPIEFPSGTMTALSCKWSFLIDEQDILVSNFPPIGDSYKYSIVEKIKEYSLKCEKLEGQRSIWHKLTCLLKHSPLECDYSHCEILIKHEIFEDAGEICLMDSYIYTYDVWQQSKTILQKNAFKQFRKDYRANLIKLFCLP